MELEAREDGVSKDPNIKYRAMDGHMIGNGGWDR